jgi:hypothetical protein
MASRILCCLAETDPDRHLALLVQLDLLDLLGQPGEKITPALTAPERAQRLQQVGLQSLRLYQLLSDSLDQIPHLTPDQQLPLRLLLAYLHKIIADETIITLSQPDQPQTATVVERPHGQKGSYRVGSASDLTATYRKHDDDKEALLGYNPTVLTTSVFIRETQVDTGAQQDNVALPEVLQSQFDHHSFFPDHVAGDMKYGYGKTRTLVAETTHGHTQIIAHLPDYDQRSGLFSPRKFTLADDGLSLACPNHQTTTLRYQTEGKGGFDFRFPAKLCRQCPLSDQCRGPASKKTAPRNVFISFYADQVEQARRFNQSDLFKRGIKIRMHIERIIYCLTHIYGARKAHSYGQPRADFQLKMQATAFNLRQLVRELLMKPPRPESVH